MNEHSENTISRRGFLKSAVSTATLLKLGFALPPGAILLSGCTGKRSESELAKRLVFAMTEKIRTLDPAYQTMALDSYVIGIVFDTLTWFNTDIEFIPRLATSWEAKNHSKEWVFKIREGVKFHDGTPLTAHDVKFHFDRLKDPETNSKRQTKVKALHSVDVIDDYTVQFNMNLSYSVWPVVIRDAFAGIISPTQVKKTGNTDFSMHPIGSGPYKVKEWDGGERLVLEKNPFHWDADKYHVEEVEFRYVAEPTTRLILAEQQSIDVCDLTYSHVEVAEKSGDIKVMQTPQLAVRYVGLNFQKPPFNNPLLRKAVNYALNKEELVKYAFRGNADPLFGPLPTVMPACDKSLPRYDYDPDKAKSLIKEAGFEKGLNVTMWTKDDAIDTNIGVVVSDQLRAVGVNVEIMRYDRNVFWDKFDPYVTRSGERYPTKDGVFDLFSAAWVGGEHPFSYLDPLFRSNSSSNNSFYANPKFDALLTKILEVADPAEQQNIFNEMQAILVEDAPWIFCYSPRIIWGVNPRVEGLKQHAAGEFEFQGVKLIGGKGGSIS